MKSHQKNKSVLSLIVSTALFLAISAVCFLPSPQTASGQIAGKQLFSFNDAASRDVEVSTQKNEEDSLAVVQKRSITIQFTESDLKESRLITIPLIDNISYEVLRGETNGLETRSTTDVTWRGKIVGQPDSSVTLTLKGGVMSGLIFASSGVYEIVPQKSGQQALVEIDQDLYPKCGGEIQGTGKDAHVHAQSTEAAIDPAAQADAGDTIDVLVLYTDDARSAAGGASNINSTIQQAVDVTNTTYSNSGINQRLRLVHTAEINYSETGNSSNDLNWIKSNSTAQSLRDQYRADLVNLIVNSSDACGIAYLMSSVNTDFASNGYSVVTRNCAVGSLSFAHELGHNMGAAHNPENANSAAYPYAYGHYVNGVFRTVMSYENLCTSGCQRIAYFSNPSVFYNGYATGVEGQRDNTRALNSTASTVANFRTQPSSGLQTGSHYQVQARHSGKCLDVSGGSMERGAAIIQYDCHNGYNQQWRLEDAGDGYYRLISRQSGKAYDVSGNSYDNNAPVIQWDRHDGYNQQWKIEAIGEGYYKLTARHSGKAFDVSGNSQSNEATIIQWDRHDGYNQQWLFRIVQ